MARRLLARRTLAQRGNWRDTMVKEIRIYVEGGARGSNKDSTNALRKGFNAFFKEIIVMHEVRIFVGK